MAQEKESLEIEGLEEGVSEVRVYELGFHLDPELPQEEVKKTYQAVRDHIASVGTVVAEGEPTRVPLSYTISRSENAGRRDFDSAYFCWIAYEADSTAHESIATMAREESRIIRHIDLRTEKEAALHAAEMHELFAKAALEPVQDEASDVELDAALKDAEV